MLKLRRSFSYIGLVMVSILWLTSCTTKQYFTIDSASYQPAVFDESSRITTLEVIVSNVDSNVIFTDMVFRNLRIPVITEDLPDQRKLVRGYIQIGGKLAEDHYQVMTEEPNKLIFTVQNRRASVPLENLERQSTTLP
ncbi:MAG TPA: hypothetical protein VKZ56_03075 [Membranihabitans sp.]|nr:hypothetical protein [Membranihabitans sp.]